LAAPTIGRGPEQAGEVRCLVRALGGQRAAFCSSHILAEVAALCERVIGVARGGLVGEGTPRELAERVGRRQRVVLRVEGPAEAVAAALAALPGVERVAREADAFVLEAAAAGDATRAAGEAMAARGWTIRELRAETPDLEQIFLRLVGDGERPPA